MSTDTSCLTLQVTGTETRLVVPTTIGLPLSTFTFEKDRSRS